MAASPTAVDPAQSGVSYSSDTVDGPVHLGRRLHRSPFAGLSPALGLVWAGSMSKKTPGKELNFGLSLDDQGLPLLVVRPTKWQRVATSLEHVTGDVSRLCKVMARAFGTNGRVRGSAVELMGDQRENILEWLRRAGCIKALDEEEAAPAAEEATKLRAKPRWSEAKHKAASARDTTATEGDDEPSEASDGVPPEIGKTEGYQEFSNLMKSWCAPRGAQNPRPPA